MLKTLDKYVKNQSKTLIFIITLVVLGFGLASNAQAVPSITTDQVVFIAARNVYLNATVNPNGNYTNVWFQIDTINPPAGSRGYQGVGNGNSSINVQAGVINLNLNTTYYYRAVAQNASGLSFGSIKSFTTPKDASFTTGSTNSGGNNSEPTTYGSITAPSVMTNGPASVTANSAVLNGSIHPNNDYVKYWFEYGETSSFGQKNPIQLLGTGLSWQLVYGNITSLKPSQDYYYRIVAQNTGGTSFGETKNLRTHSGQNTGSNTNTGVNTNTATTTNTTNNTITSSNTAVNNTSRPVVAGTTQALAVSLEYGTSNNGSLIVVADNLKPKPGETFSYTIIYKNDSVYSLNDASLKVIIPTEAEYVDASIEPSRISGNMIEFALGNIMPSSQGAVTITAKVKETTQPGITMVFTSVLSYKDSFGSQVASTSYLTMVVGEGETTPLSASIGSFLGGSGILLSAVVGFLAISGLLVYGFVKTRNGKKNGSNGNGFVFSKESGNGFSNGNGNDQAELKVPSVFMPVNGVLKK